jgi:hypothetical protein
MSHHYRVSFTVSKENLDSDSSSQDVKVIHNRLAEKVDQLIRQTKSYLSDSNRSEFSFDDFYCDNSDEGFVFSVNSYKQPSLNKLLALKKLSELFLGTDVVIEIRDNKAEYSEVQFPETGFDFKLEDVDRKCINFVASIDNNMDNIDSIMSAYNKEISSKITSKYGFILNCSVSSDLVNMRGIIDKFGSLISNRNIMIYSSYFKEDLSDQQFIEIAKQIKELNSDQITADIFVQFDKRIKSSYPIF